MSRIYKEGQGKWSRAILAAVILLGTVLLLAQLNEALPNWGTTNLPIIDFSLDTRNFVHAPILVLAAFLAYRVFNHPRTADFLIDTETELRTKVVWPSRKEEVSSSIVVIATVLVLGVLVFALDTVFNLIVHRGWYGQA
jgi:preprotein translocase subunit SecE